MTLRDAVAKELARYHGEVEAWESYLTEADRILSLAEADARERERSLLATLRQCVLGMEEMWKCEDDTHFHSALAAAKAKLESKP